MWAVEDKERWDRAHGSSRRATSRVEVWSGDTRLSESASIVDGSVTDEWVMTGVRRSLGLTVPPSRSWLSWLDRDDLELRPFLGNRFSSRLTMECPMGRFPVPPPELSRPSGPVQIQTNDYYQWVEGADFTDKPVPRPAGQVADSIGWLIRGAGLPSPLNLTTNSVWASRISLDGTRLDAIADAARSISDVGSSSSRMSVITVRPIRSR